MTDVKNLCLNEVELTEIFSKSKIIKGIYIWGYQTKDKNFVPLYVGKARNIFERIIQHYCRFNGGEYRIPQTIFIDKAPTCVYTIKTSNCYIPNNLTSIYDMLNTDNQFLKNKNTIISNFKFTYLKIRGKEKREIAEKYVADKIGHERLISSVPLPDPLPDNQFMKELDTAFSNHYKSNFK